MRRLFLLLIFAFLPSLCCASRGISLDIKKPGGGTEKIPLYKESHALLVGISDYTNGWPDLESIPGELADIESVLRKQGFNIVKILNPTSEELSDAYENFVDQYGYVEENRLLFFFSGHGYSRKDGKKGYLVPSDAPNPTENEVGFLRKAISMKKILTWAHQIESKHAMFMFDSCFSGTIFKTRALPKIPPHITSVTTKPVRQFISAGSAGEEVPARSVFALSFLKALRGEGDLDGDGYITGTELGMFLHKKVTSYEAGQTPQYGKIRDPELDEGDFVFQSHLSFGAEPQTVVAQERRLSPEDEITARNIITGLILLEKHLDNFYINDLLNWADLSQVLKADPGRASKVGQAISPWKVNSSRALRQAQEDLRQLFASQDYAHGPLNVGMMGHRAAKLSPEVSLLLFAHKQQYVNLKERILNRIYRDIGASNHKTRSYPNIFKEKRYRLAQYGSSSDYYSFSNIFEGDTVLERDFQTSLNELQSFVYEVYIPDLLAMSPFYLDWVGIGKATDLSSCGLFVSTDGSSVWPAGKIWKGNIATLKVSPSKHIKNSTGCTEHNFETGPLARVLVAYGAGQSDVKNSTEFFINALNLPGDVNANIGRVMPSTLGRKLARGIESLFVAGFVGKQTETLFSSVKKENFSSGSIEDLKIRPWDNVFDYTKNIQSSHYLLSLKEGQVSNCRDLASSKISKSDTSAICQAFIGVPLADKNNPLEAYRFLMSFDMCDECTPEISFE